MDKQQLDSLPSSDDKEFWAEADIHANLKPMNMFDEKHNFIRVPNHQAQCTHCDWGFQLDPGDKIVDGHLIDRSGKTVL
jgi:hypothetical protein